MGRRGLGTRDARSRRSGAGAPLDVLAGHDDALLAAYVDDEAAPYRGCATR